MLTVQNIAAICAESLKLLDGAVRPAAALKCTVGTFGPKFSFEHLNSNLWPLLRIQLLKLVQESQSETTEPPVHVLRVRAVELCVCIQYSKTDHTPVGSLRATRRRQNQASSPHPSDAQ